MVVKYIVLMFTINVQTILPFPKLKVLLIKPLKLIHVFVKYHIIRIFLVEKKIFSVVF